jgi:hypothetical protein
MRRYPRARCPCVVGVVVLGVVVAVVDAGVVVVGVVGVVVVVGGAGWAPEVPSTAAAMSPVMARQGLLDFRW